MTILLQRMNGSVFTSLMLVFITFTACGGSKKVMSEPVNKKTELEKRIETPSVFPYEFKKAGWKTLMSKLDIQYESTDYPLPVSSFSGQLRMVYGESIWMSVSVPLIGEIGRALITKDSIIILNKYQRCYYKEKYDFIQRFISVPVTLEKLQNLFSGNPVISTLGSINDTSGQVLKSRLEDSLMLQQVWAGLSDLWVNKAEFGDKIKKRDLSVMYQNRAIESGIPFPSQITFAVSQPSSASAIIGLSNIQLNQEFHSELKIPSGYSICKK